jgi:hypothetical protein
MNRICEEMWLIFRSREVAIQYGWDHTAFLEKYSQAELPFRELPESFHFQPTEESALNHNKESEMDDNRAFRNTVLLVCSVQGIEMLRGVMKIILRKTVVLCIP